MPRSARAYFNLIFLIFCVCGNYQHDLQLSVDRG